MKKILNEFRNIDKNIVIIMKSCIKFSFILLIISTVILFTYSTICQIPTLFYIGISVFTSSLYFIVISIVCSLSFNKIKKEMKL